MAVYLNNKLVGFTNIIDNSNTIVTPLNITSEGTYTAPTGQAYSPITVSVGPKLKSSVIRPDAELIKSYSADYLAVEDMEMQIIQPYDTTSRTPLAGGAHLTTTASNSADIDLINYDYLILNRAITIPIYNIDTTGKGREEYQVITGIYQIFNVPTDQFKSIIGNKTYTSLSQSIPGSNVSRTLIWSSATALALNTGTSYGVLQIPQVPSVSGGKIILKSPSILIRGNSTNFSSTYYNALTDVRAKYVMEVYRAPKSNLDTDGWMFLDEFNKLFACANDNFNLI